MIVYRTFSLIQIIITFFFRLTFLTIAGIALYHFNENPVITSICAAICLLFFLLSGTDEIIVFPDSIQYKSGSLLKRLRKQRSFKLADIRSIEVSGNFNTGDEILEHLW